MKTNEQILKEHIDKLVRESVNMLTEKSHNVDKRLEKKAKKVKKDSEKTMSKIKKRVDAYLNDPMTNDAEVMRQIWNPTSEKEEDSLRSEFAKKKNGTLNDNGSRYHFDNKDYIKIYNIIPK